MNSLPSHSFGYMANSHMFYILIFSVWEHYWCYFMIFWGSYCQFFYYQGWYWYKIFIILCWDYSRTWGLWLHSTVELRIRGLGQVMGYFLMKDEGQGLGWALSRTLMTSRIRLPLLIPHSALGQATSAMAHSLVIWWRWLSYSCGYTIDAEEGSWHSLELNKCLG